MPELVNVVGEVSYNGVVFGSRTKSEVEGRSVWDSAERTIIYVIYTIKVQTTIALDDQTTDATMEEIRQRLQSPGGALVFQGKGFGFLNINIQGNDDGDDVDEDGDEDDDDEDAIEDRGYKDVIWGPKPRMLSWKPVGSNRACQISWTCEVAIPECSAASFAGVPMEWNTRYSWSIDRGGYSHRMISGFIRIPQTRATQSTRTLSDNADAYRSKVVPAPIIGFRRNNEHFDLSEDKSRLDFTISDEEMPGNPYPPGVVEMSASHVVQNIPPNTCMFQASIECSIEMAKDWPRSQAWLYFLDLVKSRTDEAAKNAKLNNGDPGTILFNSLMVREPQIFGKLGFSASITYTITTSLQNLIASTGLWKPTNGSWATWTTSLSTSVFAADGRGLAKLGFSNSEEAIVDLCQSTQPKPLGAGQNTTALKSQRGGVVSQTPNASSSWLDYENKVTLDVKSYTTVMKPLPQQPPQERQLTSNSLYTPPPGGSTAAGSSSGGQQPPPGGKIINQATGSQLPYQPGQPTGDIQVRALPDVYVRMTGQAARAGFEITQPVLNQVGGFDVEPIDDDTTFFRQWIGASMFGVPIILAEWSLLYFVPQLPQDNIGVASTPYGQ